MGQKVFLLEESNHRSNGKQDQKAFTSEVWGDFS